MHSSRYFTLSLMSLTANVLLAQVQPVSPPAAPLERLTLEQALTLAEQNNPRLQVALAQRDATDAGIRTARAYPNPNMSFTLGPQIAFLDSTISGGVAQFAFQQPIELSSLRRTRINAATLNRDSSEFALSDSRIQLRSAVKQAFFTVLRRRGEIGLATENLKLIEDLRRRIQVQVDVGEAARLELVRADAEVATARTFANSARLRLVSAISALGALVSVPLSPNAEPQGQLDPPSVLPPMDQLKSEMLVRHPQLAQAQSQVRRAEAVLENEKAQRKPQPYAVTEIERYPDNYLTKFGVGLNLPIWNHREGPIAEAVAAVREAQANADLRRVELTAALETAYGQYQVTGQQVASYQEGVLQEAEAAVRAAEAAYRFGERGILDVLDAQRVLRSVRTDFLNAQFDRQAALIELERLRALEIGGNRP